ncbi:MAG: ribulose-phosphate 3-epimerase [Acidobacteriota bacterium]
MKKAKLAPSILSADFSNLSRDIDLVTEAGAEIIHVDVMDGHFVPNLTLGIPVLKSIRKITSLTLDVHLMISNPDFMVQHYIEAGADIITVQYEASCHLDRMLNSIKDGGARAGIALNPHSPVHLLLEVAGICDMILVMSVNPGFGGQAFIPSSLEKIKKARKLLDRANPEGLIEVDGGINSGNIAAVAEAGADILVAGSAIFGGSGPGDEFRRLSSVIGKVNR